MIPRFIGIIFLALVFFSELLRAASSTVLYRFANDPLQEKQHVERAHNRLSHALNNPEYMLDNWINLPVSPTSKQHQTLKLSLREAILLALRYNPNIQNAELDRIIQKYQLRLAKNEFELQYALAGTAMTSHANYSGVGGANTHSYFATPEFSYKNPFGSEAALKLDNNVVTNGSYTPLLNLSVKQPLLRGLGPAVNEVNLLNAIEVDGLNKLNVQQMVIDQVTQVINAYRALILSAHQLNMQKIGLIDANKSYKINQRLIKAGQLEPTANIQQAYQIESINLMAAQAENDFQTNAQDLLQAIGLHPNLRLAVPSDIKLTNIKIPDLNTVIKIALQHNTQYLALKIALCADERAYTVAKDQQLWQLDLAASVQAGMVTGVQGISQISNGTYGGNNVTETAGITLTVPLHDLQRRNLLIRAKIKLEQDRLSLVAAARNLITTITNTHFTIHSLMKRYELAEHQLILAEQAYALEKKKQQAGIVSSLAVNSTQNQVIQSHMGLISAKISYLNQLSALQRLTGTTLKDWHIHLRYAG